MILELRYEKPTPQHAGRENACPPVRLPETWILINDIVVLASLSLVLSVMSLNIYRAFKQSLLSISERRAESSERPCQRFAQFTSLFRAELRQDGAGYFFIIALMLFSLWFVQRLIPLSSESSVLQLLHHPSFETGVHSIGCALATMHLGIVHMELERYARLVSNLRGWGVVEISDDNGLFQDASNTADLLGQSDDSSAADENDEKNTPPS